MVPIGVLCLQASFLHLLIQAGLKPFPGDIDSPALAGTEVRGDHAPEEGAKGLIVMLGKWLVLPLL